MLSHSAAIPAVSAVAATTTAAAAAAAAADSPDARPDFNPSDSSEHPEKPGEGHPDDKGPNNVQEGQNSKEAPPSSPIPKKKTISMGVIIGIAVAGAAGLVGLVALLCCCYVKKKRAQKAALGEKVSSACLCVCVGGGGSLVVTLRG